MTGLFEGVGIALDSLRSNKGRAALTILGVAIGVMVVMVIAAITMTTVTPMATPRIVNAARRLLPRSESSAMPTPSKRAVTSRAAGRRSDRVARRGSPGRHRR